MTDVVRLQLDLADAVLAAADLDAKHRRDADFDMEVGDPEFAILTAVLGARSPLPAGLLGQVREGVLAGWYRSEDITGAMLAAVDSQTLANTGAVIGKWDDDRLLAPAGTAVAPSGTVLLLDQLGLNEATPGEQRNGIRAWLEVNTPGSTLILSLRRHGYGDLLGDRGSA